MKKAISTKKVSIKQITIIGMLSAMSFALSALRFPFPPAPFLKIEISDTPVLMGTYLYGTSASVLISLISSFLQIFNSSSGSGMIGFMMNIISSITFSFTVSLIYQKQSSSKTRLVIAHLAGVIIMTISMAISNILLTPLYMKGVSREAVIAMLIPSIVPFNLVKGTINSVLGIALRNITNLVSLD